MKIIFAISALGHVNPMLGIVRILLVEGHEVVAVAIDPSMMRRHCRPDRADSVGPERPDA
jgi:hypothetical protein